MEYNHENLIKVLNEKFDLDLKINGDKHFGDVLELDTNNINHAVILFAKALNINSASSGARDLYKLLQVYITDSDKQIEINKIIKHYGD